VSTAVVSVAHQWLILNTGEANVSKTKSRVFVPLSIRAFSLLSLLMDESTKLLRDTKKELERDMHHLKRTDPDMLLSFTLLKLLSVLFAYL